MDAGLTLWRLGGRDAGDMERQFLEEKARGDQSWRERKKIRKGGLASETTTRSPFLRYLELLA